MADITQDPAIAAILAQMPPAQAQNLAQVMQAAAARQGGGRGLSKRHRAEVALPVERSRLWNNYYSIVRFQSLVGVAPPITTLTFGIQELRPFSYRIGDALITAGFDPTFPGVATEAETNLVKAGETIAGQLVKVHGLSLMPSSVTDIELWKQLIASISVSISMDGDANKYRLGRPDMLPGSGGTFGSSPTLTVPPNVGDTIQISSGFSNGWPVVDNFYPFPEPLIWSPSGETDSNFNVVLRLQRQQVIVETARVAVPPGVAAYTPPTAAGQFGTFVDIMVRLHTEQLFPRSVNQ